MADMGDGGGGKPRKRPAAKAATRPPAAKVKATIHLAGEADKRLSRSRDDDGDGSLRAGGTLDRNAPATVRRQ